MSGSDGRDRVVALDKQRVWHPYTEMSHYREQVEPLVIESACGSRLRDADGREYIDGNASWWTCALGHAHPRLVAALTRQAEVLGHTALAGIAHENAAELAEALCTVAPDGLEHVFFSDDGSTAVEVAMKLCLQYWVQNGQPKKLRFVALEDAFHGETLGVTALGGVEVFRKPFQDVLLDCLHVPPPRHPYDSAGAFAALEKTIAGNADTLAAVVLEPLVQGAAGMYTYDAEYLRHARALCDRHDVFLVCDEVFSGYGRTGRMWASEHAGISPDVLCTAKGFTGGLMPMAATLATRRLFEGFLGDPERAFYYGHTFCGNPLGSAVAREVLRVYEDEQVLEGIAPRHEKIAATFEALGGLPGVARTRSLGMIGALDLGGDSGYLAAAGWRVYELARARGAYLRPLGNVVYVTPSLNIPEHDLDRLLAIVSECVGEVAS
ncbi:MAG: adenosylmethionine--8-amino-7-oxononanoate transaminase [Deltaproteobacteria bacterium]|nr:adenosylmethionine--8-amino-7-oxononanoate transaminase [Deltaproteobacteria bacterium]MBW2359466.1 adenosylmethionine--8-amino-7-oxononanoate transaminase [Deltaproteobacteria bacterium]